ncbi:MAG: AAA family ATPase, partial [Thermodesulfobacteriota bacterium]
MKIQEIYLDNIGQLNRSCHFINEWRGTIHDRILFSGPNGSGKTLILKTIAMLWNALGHWLDHRAVTHAGGPINQCIKNEQSAAMVLTDIPHCKGPVILFFGNPNRLESISEKYADLPWIGETTSDHQGGKRSLKMPKETWIDAWADARRKLILSFDESDTPNMVWFDAEERRWVSPRRNLGKPLSENPAIRWLVTYQVTEDWQGQLEASLINLKSTKLHAFHQIIRDLNDFLYDKEIDPNVKPGENRLEVILKNRKKKRHSLDELSSGEHQILIQLFMIRRWLQPGGIVLIDEPDLFLHPSLVAGFLSKLESLVMEKQGQLITTSHNPDVWRRYETKGLRIKNLHLPPRTPVRVIIDDKDMISEPGGKGRWATLAERI